MRTETTRHGVNNKLKDVKSKIKSLWLRDQGTVDDPGQISQGSSTGLEAPPTNCLETHLLNDRQRDVKSQDPHSKLNNKRHNAFPHDTLDGKQFDQFRQCDQFVDNSSIQPASAPPKKPDLWQRAFDSLELEKQQLIKSIPVPKCNNLIECNDANINPDTVGRLKALSGVVETVKIQYEIEQEKSRIKEPAQKIIKAVLSFQDFIQAAVAFDPTGHATSVWAVVSLGLTMTQNHRSQKVAWLESCAFLTDILNRYSFVEDEYRTDPNTDEHIETGLVQVYAAVLRFAALVQSLYNRGRAVWIWKSMSGDSLSELQKSIDEAESHLGRWLQIVDRREQRESGNRLLEKADQILTKIDCMLDSVNEIHDKIVFAELRVAEEARYNAYTGEEYQECLQDTRTELLEDIKNWATDPDRQAVFWLQGMAGTGKSTVSRTVARWLDDEGLLGGSFFFKKGGTDREDARRLFTTITKQIMGRLFHLQQPVKKAIRDSHDIGSCNPQEQFDELLYKPLKSLNLGLRTPLILVVVIDALDECQVPADVKNFLSTLPKLNDLKDVQLRMFITSRPEPPVNKGFRPIDRDEIVLHTVKRSTIEHDISTFLRKKLDEIRDDYQLPQGWPGDENLKALVDMAVPLFIYAATICRFISCDGELPDARLHAILSSRLSDGMKKIDSEYSKLTDIYLPVLEHIVLQKKPTELRYWMDDFRRIVGAVILLFSPLSSVSLAKLICYDETKVRGRLNSLQSVLSVPKDSDTPIQLLHLSFREFLIDHSASDKFWIHEPAGHTQLARDCLQYMEQELQKDIYRISHPGMKRDDIDRAALERNISPELRYACRYWIRHLENSELSAINWGQIEDFLKLHFLHWVEVMSLFGWVSETIHAIIVLQSLGKKIDREHSKSTNIYFPILEHIVLQKKPKEREDWMADFHRIIGALVLLFSPLSSISLAKLICFDKTKVQGSLNSLQTLVRVPKDSDDPILFFHVSFRDFLVDHSASNKFWIHESASHMQLARDCLQYMEQELQKDICRLSHPGVKRGSIDKAVLEKNISPELRYACRYWTLHLERSEPSAINWTLIEGFLESHFLHWVEVMSLFGWVSEIIHAIAALQSLGKSPRLAEFLYDAERFVLKNRQIADEAPLQIYCAGLVFSPRTAIIREKFQSELPDWICRFPQVHENWSAELQTLEGHTGWVESVAFSPDGRLLASGSVDNTIRLWDPATGALQQTLEGHTDSVQSLAFSPDGRLLASSSVDKTVRLWDPTTDTLQQTLEGHTDSVQSLAFSPDGRLLASGSVDNTVRLWDPATGALQQTFEGHTDSVESVAFSPDGRLLASGSVDNTVQLWDPTTGTLQQTLEGHTDSVESVAFSPDGRLLASGSGDNTVRLWDPATGTLQQTFEGHTDSVESMAFSPDGRLLASGSVDNTVRLWDPNTGTLQQTLEGHTDSVRSLAFSSDGRLLASGSDDKTVRLWDPATGTLQEILSTEGSITELEFSPDGSYLHTNLGSFKIQSSCGNPIPDSPNIDPWVSLQSEWIAVKGKQVLWLPPEARYSCSATKSNTLALGHRSGWVSFLGFLE